MRLQRYISSTHMPQRESWLACVQAAADAGFEGVELFGLGYEREEQMAGSALVELAAMARHQGIRLTGHPWMDWCSIPEQTLILRLRRLVEDCARMEQHAVNLHMGFLTSHQFGMERLFAAVDPLISFLQAQGMMLLFENVPDYGKQEPGAAVADFEALFAHYDQSTPIMLNIDNGHANLTGQMETLTERFAARWRYTHINDNDGVKDLHSAPGQGTVNWDVVAVCAAQANYRGPLLMEFAMQKVTEAMPVLEHAFGVQGFML